MKIGAIIQARTSSTRLPQKVLKPLPFNSKTNVLQQVIRRVSKSELIDEIIIATTIHDEDEKIVEVAKKENIKFYKGSLENVLERYYNAALENSLDVVVRITSDCPCADANIIDEIIKKLQSIADSCETVLLCDDLDHMKRGGRLTPMAAALGGLLKIKPVLHIGKSTNGKVDVLDKVRTMKRAQDRVIKHLKELNVDSNYTFIVAHVDALDAAKEYAQKIESQIEGAKVKVINLVSAVGIHTGLGCLALQVFNEMKD